MISRKVVLFASAAVIVAAALLLASRWYVAHDAWEAERASSMERYRREQEAWEAHLRAPWHRLTEVDGDFHEAAQSIIKTMTASGLNQADYRIKIFQWPGEELYEVTLKHLAHFDLEREGKTKDMLGDPCGHCFRVICDSRRKVVSRLLNVQ